MQLLEGIAAEKTFINVTLPGVEESYRSRLLSLDDHDGDIALSLTPLEPAKGNLKIRSCRGAGAINISFVAKNQQYQGTSTFLNVVMVNSAQVLRLSLPDQLETAGKIRRRGENRVVIPEHVELTATVAVKGFEKIAGMVEDLSPGGLSFSCLSLPTPLTGGNKAGLVIGGSLLKGETIPVTGIVRRCVVLRHNTDTHCCVDHYGIQFHHLSQAASMAVDRLIRLRIPPAEDAWFMTEQVRYKSG